MKNHNLIIEKFIENELDGEQLKWFQEQLRTNPHFVKQYKLHLEVNEAIKENNVMELREKLDKIYQAEIKKKTRPVITLSSRTWLIAASVLLVITLATAYEIFMAGYSPEKLYSMYYEPYQTIIKVRSAEESVNSIVEKGLHAYENKNYEKAITHFQSTLEKESDNHLARFYLGIAFMETQQYGEAIESFQEIKDQQINLFVQQANWYLGLALLKTGEKQKAIHQFSQIVKNKGYYQGKAEKILKHLNT